MANVTQTIPNLTQGISQQPDEYKVPGQVTCLLYTSPSPRDSTRSRMPSSA